VCRLLARHGALAPTMRLLSDLLKMWFTGSREEWFQQAQDARKQEQALQVSR
jgi:hypothetical protein